MNCKALWLFILTLLIHESGFSQGLFEESVNKPADGEKLNIDFNGYGRASAYGGSKSFDYSSVFAGFAMQGKVAIDKAFLFTDLRVRGGTAFDSLYTEIELKETYAGFQSAKLDVYLGAKIVGWGKMDGFNPTDNITPYNYFFLSGTPDDQKLPNFLLQAIGYLSPKINIEIIAIPVYRPSVYRYDLFNLTEYATFTAPTLPAKTFENGSLAARLNFDFPKASWSVSWFRGFDPFYGFRVKDISWEGFVPSISLTAEPYLKNTIGADVAVTMGSWITRAEAAYDITRNYRDNMNIPNPGIALTAGIEHRFWGTVTLLQYIGYFTFDFVSLDDLPAPVTPDEIIAKELTGFNRKIFYQQEKFNHALSLSLSRSFAYESVAVEAMGYYNITSEEWFIRPKISWNITDYLQTSAGGFYYAGPDQSVFFYAADVLNGAFIELKVMF